MGVYDASSNNAYFAMWEGSVVSINLPRFTYGATLRFPPPGDGGVLTGFIDPETHMSFWGTRRVPGAINQVDTPAFTQVTSMPLEAADGMVYSVVFDQKRGAAFWGMGYGSGAAAIIRTSLYPLERTGALLLNGDEYNILAATLDESGDFAYFGASGARPGVIVKVDLNTFTRVSSLVLESSQASRRWCPRTWIRCDTTRTGACMYLQVQWYVFVPLI
jgi:hypothetical protein